MGQAFSDEEIVIFAKNYGDGREGNDIQYFTKEEVIADVLREYERFIELASDTKHDLLQMEG